jgi:hypothetical protein
MFSGFSRPGLLVVAKLAWGVLYGLGFGAGIGYAFHTARKNPAAEIRESVVSFAVSHPLLFCGLCHTSGWLQ